MGGIIGYETKKKEKKITICIYSKKRLERSLISSFNGLCVTANLSLGSYGSSFLLANIW